MSPASYDARLLNDIAAAASATGDAATRGKRVAEMIRQACNCFWVGIFEIANDEAHAVAWTGTEAPAFLHFPLTRGITRDVVRTRKSALVNDVLKDSRYLVAFSNTRAEIVSPIVDAMGSVVGTIEADADKVNSFSDADVQFLDQCASRITSLV
ncbi:MAG TPA: GAF domain-containing protein, partial [Candidatus Acidoferrales bacterium]|nr:GAF domain-containing protein [Candidatus Acidoferrales bacterium]